MERDEAELALDQADDEPTDGGVLDEFDDAVLAADDTGMLSAERSITSATIEQGIEGDV